MYWDKTYECMDREQLRELQSRRLVETVRRVYHHVPYYRQRMQELGIVPEDINGVEDLHKLPFTTKQDLRDNYPYGLFAVPLSEIVRLHASSALPEAYRSRIHTQRYCQLVRTNGKNTCIRRHAYGFSYSGSIWVWPVYRWTGSSLWC